MATKPYDADIDYGAAVGRQLQALDLAERAMQLASLAAQAAGYAHGSRARNTRRAYAADWSHFVTWCALAGLQAMPADPMTITLYLTAHASSLTVATLRRRLTTIGQAHTSEGLDNPCAARRVREVWAGITRSRNRPQVKKTPLVVEGMRAVLDTIGDDVRGQRNRALLLLAWGGALRRSEVCALRTGDVRIEDRGLVLAIRKSKSDQVGAGRQVGLPWGRRAEYCPVRAYQRWAEHLKLKDVPVFVRVGLDGTPGDTALNDKHVARLVKFVADRAGLQGDYSGHSLRAGFATAAAAAGASERAIMGQTGHRSLLIMRGYIRPATLFDDNAAAVAAL